MRGYENLCTAEPFDLSGVVWMPRDKYQPFGGGAIVKLPATVFRKDAVTDEHDAFVEREEKFSKQHQNDTDEELLRYLCDCAAKLGQTPAKREIVGFTYLKSRFGPWPRVLEKAGLKETRKKKAHRQK